MSEIPHNFLVVYAGEILTGIVVAVVSVAASHIFYRFKLRKEQKVRFQDVIGEKIANALLAVWDIERKAHTQEIYDIEKRLDEEQVSFLNPEGVYLAIMSDSNAFLEFVSEINDARGDYEKYLSDEVAAHLWYGSSRFMEMANFIAREGMVNHYPEMGTIFLFDILDWRDSLEKAIVRDINRHSTKVVAHRGKKWEKAKEKLQEKLHKKNVLNELINNPNGEEARMLYLFIDGLRESDKNAEEEIMKCLRCEKEMEKVTLSQGIVLYEGKTGDKQQEPCSPKSAYICKNCGYVELSLKE